MIRARFLRIHIFIFFLGRGIEDIVEDQPVARRGYKLGEIRRWIDGSIRNKMEAMRQKWRSKFLSLKSGPLRIYRKEGTLTLQTYAIIRKMKTGTGFLHQIMMLNFRDFV
jgi:hypothetical protein